MKMYDVQMLDGEIITFEGEDYKKFLKANNLDMSQMYKTLKGKVPYCKGYVLKRIHSVGYENIAKMTEVEMKHYKTATTLRDQANSMRSVIRSNSRIEWIKDNLLTAIKELKPLPKIEGISNNRSKNPNRIAICPISDWHLGIEINNSLNKFNIDILRERVLVLQETIIENVYRDMVSKVIIVNLGDMINGIIHESLRYSSEIDVSKQVILVAEIISDMISVISYHVDVDYYGTYGNHERMFKNKSESIDSENFGNIINYFIKQRCANEKNIKVYNNEITEDIISFTELGLNIMGSHGDKDSIVSVFNNFINMSKKIPDIILLGHFHHRISKDYNNCSIIVNQSLSGADSYATSIRKSSKPAQTYILIDKYGVILEETIRCDIYE